MTPPRPPTDAPSASVSPASDAVPSSSAPTAGRPTTSPSGTPTDPVARRRLRPSPSATPSAPPGRSPSAGPTAAPPPNLPTAEPSWPRSAAGAARGGTLPPKRQPRLRRPGPHVPQPSAVASYRERMPLERRVTLPTPRGTPKDRHTLTPGRQPPAAEGRRNHRHHPATGSRLARTTARSYGRNSSGCARAHRGREAPHPVHGPARPRTSTQPAHHGTPCGNRSSASNAGRALALLRLRLSRAASFASKEPTSSTHRHPPRNHGHHGTPPRAPGPRRRSRLDCPTGSTRRRDTQGTTGTTWAHPTGETFTTWPGQTEPKGSQPCPSPAHHQTGRTKTP
jgi:hypothetical protein